MFAIFYSYEAISRYIDTYNIITTREIDEKN